ISNELVKKHRDMVPRQYGRQIAKMGEVRYRPGIVSLIPKTLYLSPAISGDAQAWGASWSIIGAGIAKSFGNFRPSLNGSLLATAMYINSPSTQADHYFFLRPGVELGLDFEFKLTEQFLLSIGWTSQVYIPQTLRSSGIEMLGMGG